MVEETRKADARRFPDGSGSHSHVQRARCRTRDEEVARVRQPGRSGRVRQVRQVGGSGGLVHRSSRRERERRGRKKKRTQTTDAEQPPADDEKKGAAADAAVRRPRDGAGNPAASVGSAATRPGTVPGAWLWGATTNGPLAAARTRYQARLTVDVRLHRKPITVKKAPAVDRQRRELRARFELASRNATRSNGDERRDNPDSRIKTQLDEPRAEVEQRRSEGARRGSYERGGQVGRRTVYQVRNQSNQDRSTSRRQ